MGKNDITTLLITVTTVLALLLDDPTPGIIGVIFIVGITFVVDHYLSYEAHERKNKNKK